MTTVYLLHFITIIFHAEQNLLLSQHIIEFTLYSVFRKYKCQTKIIHMYHYFKRTVFINNKTSYSTYCNLMWQYLLLKPFTLIPNFLVVVVWKWVLVLYLVKGLIH